MNDMTGLLLERTTRETAVPVLPSQESFGLVGHAFLRASSATGGGMILDIALPRTGHDAMPDNGTSVAAGKATLVIGADDSITLILPGGEMGQGINAALAQIMAEELPLDFTRIRTIPAPYSAEYGVGPDASQATTGSHGVRAYFGHMLDAGATARAMLIAAAAARSSAPHSLHAMAGHTDPTSGAWIPNCVEDGTGKRWSYGELAADAALTTPTITRISDPSAYKVIGTRQIRPDIRDKVNGKAVFGLDVRLPGMRYAAVKHAPMLGAKVVRMGSAAPGLQAVNLDTAVAVIAPDSWSARKAINALQVDWTSPSFSELSFVDTAIQNSSLTSLLNSPTAAVAEASPDDATASSLLRLINSQPRKLTLTYSFPMLAHACMEVLNCTVEVLRAADDDSVEAVNVWCPTQAPDHVARTVSGLVPSLDMARITVTTTLMGGGFGRKLEQDYVAQAVRVALAARAPIKLMWWREEDFARDHFRPAAMSKIQIGLDKQGKIQGWYNRVAAPSVLRSHGLLPEGSALSRVADPVVIGSATGNGEEPMPYKDAMARRVVDYVEQKTGFPLGFWRSAGQSISCFAVESAIDECARLLGEDPYTYRVALLEDNPPMKALLNDVAALSGWAEPPAPGTARGMALSPGAGSRAALVVELRKVTSGNASTIRVSRIFCSVDCGTAVNPDQVVAQIQGGVLQGLSAARWGRISFDKGVCQVRNFGHYRLSRMADTPEIVVRIVEQGSALGGVGEVGVPPVAPALANAYAALTGLRKRTLPLEF